MCRGQNCTSISLDGVTSETISNFTRVLPWICQHGFGITSKDVLLVTTRQRFDFFIFFFILGHVVSEELHGKSRVTCSRSLPWVELGLEDIFVVFFLGKSCTTQENYEEKLWKETVMKILVFSLFFWVPYGLFWFLQLVRLIWTTALFCRDFPRP